MVFPSLFHLTAMYRSRNIVPIELGTRSNSVGNIQNKYTHVPSGFTNSVPRPRSGSSFPMFREHGF
jgi:hypothetical protein